MVSQNEHRFETSILATRKSCRCPKSTRSRSNHGNETSSRSPARSVWKSLRSSETSVRSSPSKPSEKYQGSTVAFANYPFNQVFVQIADLIVLPPPIPVFPTLDNYGRAQVPIARQVIRGFRGSHRPQIARDYGWAFGSCTHPSAHGCNGSSSSATMRSGTTGPANSGAANRRFASVALRDSRVCLIMQDDGLTDIRVGGPTVRSTVSFIQGGNLLKQYFDVIHDRRSLAHAIRDNPTRCMRVHSSAHIFFTTPKYMMKGLLSISAQYCR